MAKRMLIDASHPEETRVVVLDGTKIEDYDFESTSKQQLKGNVYLAKVTRVEPSLQAAFVEYGGNRHGFLAFSEIHPDYYRIPVEDRERLLEEEFGEGASDGLNDPEPTPSEPKRRGRRGRGSDRSAEPPRSEDAEVAEEGEKPPRKRRSRRTRRRSSEVETAAGDGEIDPSGNAEAGAGEESLDATLSETSPAEAEAEEGDTGLAPDGAEADIALTEEEAEEIVEFLNGGDLPDDDDVAVEGAGLDVSEPSDALDDEAARSDGDAGDAEGTQHTAVGETDLADQDGSSVEEAEPEAVSEPDAAPDALPDVVPEAFAEDLPSAPSPVSDNEADATATDPTDGPEEPHDPNKTLLMATDREEESVSGPASPFRDPREPDEEDEREGPPTLLPRETTKASEIAEATPETLEAAPKAEAGEATADEGPAAQDTDPQEGSQEAGSTGAAAEDGTDAEVPANSEFEAADPRSTQMVPSLAASLSAAGGEEEGDGNGDGEGESDGDDTAPDLSPEDRDAAEDGELTNSPAAEEAKARGDVESIGGDDVEEMAARRSKRPRRVYKIQEVIKRRQILLVQVNKEERGNKGAALSTYLSLAGRYCVLMPNTPRGGGVSRKISNPADRKKMKALLEELDLPPGMAVILRTAGLERTKTEIKRDLDYLLRLWDQIRETTFSSIAPCLIHEEANLIKRAIRDLYSKDIEEILVEGEEGYRIAKDFMKMLMPSHAKKVKLYRDEFIPLFHRYQVEQQMEAMLTPTVQLKSGGYIVINPTEALVAIDVNSGRATKERNIEETAYRTNLEAAEEIARQLRLRDLAGLVVIDFIDMEEDRHNANVERKLKEAMKSDRARIQVGRISPFGLLELSRQRLRPSLMETHFEVSPYCGGTGMIRTVESSTLHVLRAVVEEGIRKRSAEILVKVPLKVALYLLNQKRDALREIEERYGMRVLVEEDRDLYAPNFTIEKLRSLAEGPSIMPSVLSSATPAVSATKIAEEADDVEEEAVADPEEGSETAEEEEGGRRRRGRRRRRRSGEGEQARTSKSDVDEEASPGEEGETDAGSDDDDGSSVEGQASPESSEDDDDARRRRRRRGKRGGRRRRPGRSDEDAGQDDDVAAAPSDGTDADDVKQSPEESLEADSGADGEDATQASDAGPLTQAAAEDAAEETSDAVDHTGPLGGSPDNVRPVDADPVDVDADDSDRVGSSQVGPSPNETEAVAGQAEEGSEPAPPMEGRSPDGGGVTEQASMTEAGTDLVADPADAEVDPQGEQEPEPEPEENLAAKAAETVNRPPEKPRRGWWQRVLPGAR